MSTQLNTRRSQPQLIPRIHLGAERLMVPATSPPRTATAIFGELVPFDY
jgi:hypothetical protein